MRDDRMASNLDHYRLDADYKHGMHFTALPTAWVSGFEKEAVLRIGSSTAWTTSTVGATAGFLEYKGQGLKTFERAQDRDERLMAVLGARLLESQKKVGETAESIELRQSGENSILGHMALSLGASLNHGPWPVATLEVFCIIDGGEEGPVGTVASTATAFTHGSVAQGESSLSYRVRYRNGAVIGPVSAWFPWDISLP